MISRLNCIFVFASFRCHFITQIRQRKAYLGLTVNNISKQLKYTFTIL